MQKLISAGAAVLLIGIGAFSTSWTDAQRAPRPEAPREKEPPRVVFREKEDAHFVQMRREQPHPGTWQVIPHHDTLLLLNSATGETFMLEGNDDGPFWRPVPRRGMERPEPARERMNPERVEQRLKELRKQLEKTRGEGRERIERAIEELERSRGKRGEERDRPERDHERHMEELEEVMHELEEKIGDMKERWEESDSVREREKLEKAIKELKEEADRVRNELKELRR